MERNYERGKAIIFVKPEEVELREIKLAEVDDETIVVKTKYSGISTGTEMAIYKGEEKDDEDVKYPCVPGYEEVGEVVYVGANAFKTNRGEILKVGDRVMANEVRFYPDYAACWGGQCEYAIKNPKTSPALMDRPAKIPENVSYQEAVIAYLASVAKKGIDMVGIKSDESVLIIGAGVVGLSAIQLAGIYGDRVIAGDIMESRLKIAERYTPYTLNLSKPDSHKKLLEMNNGEKVDVVIECSGNPSVVNTIPDYIKSGGRIHLLGHYRKPVVITNYGRWNCNDLRISCSIALNPGAKEEILKLISEGKFDAKSLYTEEFPVDDAPKAYKELENNNGDILKILFRWEE